jgi:hypothetical protein
MASNQNGSGRNVALPDENRPSWRPQDQNVRSRGEEGRYRDDRDDDRYMSEERYEGSRGGRQIDAFGQGQSGYAAGRYGEDRSMQFQNRNESYPQGGQRYYEDRPRQTMGLDDRYTGRGGSEYWQDRQDRPDRGIDRGYDERQRGYPGGYSQSWQGSQSSGPNWQGWHGGREGMGSHPRIGDQGYTSFKGGSAGAESTGMGGRYPQGYGEQPHPVAIHRGKGPIGYTRSDERIREQVCEALSDDPYIDASHIEVVVKNGEVILTGAVDDRQTKRAAEELVENCPGVKDVQNQLRVQPMQGMQNRGNQGQGSMVGKNETETSDKKHRA